LIVLWTSVDAALTHSCNLAHDAVQSNLSFVSRVGSPRRLVSLFASHLSTDHRDRHVVLRISAPVRQQPDAVCRQRSEASVDLQQYSKVASPGFVARRGRAVNLVMGLLTAAFRAGCSNCSMNSFVTNAVMNERAVSC